VEQRLLSSGGVRIRRLAVVAFLVTAVFPAAALAQESSRFAIGGEFTVAATDHASTEDHAHSTYLPGILWRFGTTDPGWGFHWGLNWYAVDIDRPIGGTSTVLGELRVRPIMAGYGYTWVVRRNAVTADLLGGFAFGSMSISGAAVDAYRTRTGVQVLDADASNVFVLKPEVAIWHNINKLLGLNINVGYMLARPEVRITTSSGLDARRARADQFLVKVGLVYSIF
jgi:hypothetical protein